MTFNRLEHEKKRALEHLSDAYEQLTWVLNDIEHSNVPALYLSKVLSDAAAAYVRYEAIASVTDEGGK
jgi:hypothetical protein